MVHGGGFTDAVLRSVQCRNSSHLNRGEDAVVVVALDFRKRANHVGIPHTRSYPPARHVIGFGKGEKLHPHVLRPLRLKERGALVPIERDFGICHIVDDDDIVFLRVVYDFLEKIEAYGSSRRIVREVQRNDARFRPDLARDFGHAGNEILFLMKGNGDDISPRERDAVDVDRVRGVRDKRQITRVYESENKVSYSFFRTDGGDDLLFPVQAHAVLSIVVPGDCFEQCGNSARGGIAVGLAILRDFDELVHNVFRCGTVRIAHRKVYDIHALLTELEPHPVDACEKVRWQALQATGKDFGHLLPPDGERERNDFQRYQTDDEEYTASPEKARLERWSAHPPFARLEGRMNETPQHHGGGTCSRRSERQ
ncbi:MAG: hypothetical protein BWY06_02654 [Candidatus Latescibacteria bacterium ADurb.Bin168]|nr:MAG: hypothetical protein BWY06_02654 [Candidatus Latescibacteria bacterium ADurb.Bin168]